jgi:hypothetical protein
MGISNRFRAGLVGGGMIVATAGALAAVGLAAAALAGAGPAASAAGAVTPLAVTTSAKPTPPTTWAVKQLGDHKDATFNKLLGINDNGRVAGFFGSGAKGHPNQGYTIRQPWKQSDLANENFPHAKQTVVTGLNNHNVQVGFFSTQNNASGVNNNFGWYFNGKFHKVVFPHASNASPTKDQLRGVNDHDIAVGFYKDSAGLDRGYTFNIKTGKFALVTKPGESPGGSSPSLRANAIDNAGDVAGSYTSDGVTEGFLKLADGTFITIAIPGASSTTALGVNNDDTVVGAFTAGSGSKAVTNGFVWLTGGSSVVETGNINGIRDINITGINDKNILTGFYVDSKGHTDGFLGIPVTAKPVTSSLPDFLADLTIPAF